MQVSTEHHAKLPLIVLPSSVITTITADWALFIHLRVIRQFISYTSVYLFVIWIFFKPFFFFFLLSSPSLSILILI